MYYETADDAVLYLGGSYVRYRGRPVRVDDVVSIDGVKTAFIRSVHTGARNTVPLEKLNLNPIKLGYYFDERANTTIYVERWPRRGWRQGICRDNVRGRNTGMFGWPDLGMEDLKNMLVGNHKPFKEAIKEAKKLGTPYPFSRRFAIGKDGVVYFKTEAVGLYTEENGMMFSEGFKFLKEAFEEDVYEIN